MKIVDISVPARNGSPAASLTTGEWTPELTAGTHSDDQISLIRGGADAADLGFEVWPPNFILEVKLR